MLLSRVKICFRAKSQLVFHWGLYKKVIFLQGLEEQERNNICAKIRFYNIVFFTRSQFSQSCVIILLF